MKGQRKDRATYDRHVAEGICPSSTTYEQWVNALTQLDGLYAEDRPSSVNQSLCRHYEGMVGA